jgi:putative ABC transport system permease protein
MAVPVSYNVRNLIVRKTTTIMTALGIALTVAVLLSVMGLVNGLDTALASTGDPLNIMVLRRGSTAELTSAITRQQYQDIRALPGIARNAKGEPLVSLEMITVIQLVSVDAPDGINVNIRGLTQTGIDLRHGLKLKAGRWFQQGRNEIVVGSLIAKRFPDAKLGNKIRFGRSNWEVVGVMDAGESATNSEIFGDLNLVSADYNRLDVPSSVLVRATDAVAADALTKEIKTDQRLDLDAISERDYYDKQSVSAAPIKFLGGFVAVIMAVGSSFAAMNTMFAAVSRRSKEIGTLRVLGFSRSSILLSFFVESVLLAAFGGLIGCLLVLPLNGITTGIGNFVTFSETSFALRITPIIMLLGLGFAMLLGALGGFFPARNAATKQILVALREI